MSFCCSKKPIALGYVVPVCFESCMLKRQWEGWLCPRDAINESILVQCISISADTRIQGFFHFPFHIIHLETCQESLVSIVPLPCTVDVHLTAFSIHSKELESGPYLQVSDFDNLPW